MKKYLPGIIASLMAIGMFAFTEKPMKEGKKGFYDVCSNSEKKWYMINYNCAAQTSLSLVRSPSSYTATTGPVVGSTCTGTECICAIWACPGINGTLPIINSQSLIFNELYYYYLDGTPCTDIMSKDETIGQRRKE